MRTEKYLGEWLMNAALFVATVLVFQVVSETMTASSVAVAVLLGIAVSALLLLAGLWVLSKAEDDGDDGSAGSGTGRSNAIRAGVRKASRAGKASRAAKKDR